MDLGLKGRKAIVTGGTRGIGRAIAEQFADEGADVAFCARNPEQVAATAKALEAKGVKAYGTAIDVADVQAYMDWIKTAAGQLGGLDAFVSNVSAMNSARTVEGWKAGFDLDILSTAMGIETAVPLLERLWMKSRATLTPFCFMEAMALSPVKLAAAADSRATFSLADHST